MRFKVGDLVRSVLSKQMGVIVSGPEIHQPVANGRKEYKYRVYWTKKGETSRTSEIWLLPFKRKKAEADESKV